MAASAPHLLVPRVVSRVALRKSRQTSSNTCCFVVTKRFVSNGSFSQDSARPSPTLSQLRPPQPNPRHGHRLMSDYVPDLQRFLLEVGTDPREARYWLKQFTEASKQAFGSFALVYVEDPVFSSTEELASLASSISFLQRNLMKTVVVVGNVCRDKTSDAVVRKRAVANMVELTNKLECNMAVVRPLFPGSGVVEITAHDGSTGTALEVSPALIQCSLLMNSVPILTCFGETAGGQMLAVNEDSLILELTKVIQPLKIIHINKYGGFIDDQGNRIANVHLPADLSAAAGQAWCVESIRRRMESMYDLLKNIPPESSAVITSSEKMLSELFSHRDSCVVANQRSGFKRSGTFFTIIEKIHTYSSLNDVDEPTLVKLLDSSFQKSLRGDYLNEIRDQIIKIFVSERYNAAAIVLEDKEAGIPYLCKFAVSPKAQGAGTGETLWRMVRKEFKQLFWRSQHRNPVNPWYFRQSEGSWSDKEWTVFWCGIQQPAMSSRLVEAALAKSPSFLPPGVTRDMLAIEQSSRTSIDSPE